MRVAIVHDDVGSRDAPDALDVLEQAEAVQDAVTGLGHTAGCFPCTLDLADLMRRLTAWKADLVFNLVESLEGKGRLIHLVPSCLEALGIPFTGAGAEAMFFTSHKVMAKKWMVSAGIPTPPWVGPCPEAVGDTAMRDKGSDTWIIKSVWEHASIGLDEKSLVQGATPETAFSLLTDRAAQLGGSCFAERFIEGREFNLSLLAGPKEVQVMPPAEIVFEDYGADMLRIVDYAAKWDKNTFAYQHTVRRFEFPPADKTLLTALALLARRCWEVFRLGGYARVDFRVDAKDHPWVLEVNANPCLSPDAGYAAALAEAGLPFREAVRRIMGDVQAEQIALVVNDRHDIHHADNHRIHGVVLRNELQPQDVERVRHLVEITGFFSPAEVDVAAELVTERLTKGAESGYEFILAEHHGRLAGYACFGPIPATAASYDLYWIAVHPDFQRKRLGRRLLKEAEMRISSAGGKRIYVDTSERVQYSSTRAFYERFGYRLETILEDFYQQGEGKVIYCKNLG